MIQLFSLLIEDLLQSVGRGILRVPPDHAGEITAARDRAEFHTYRRSLRIPPSSAVKSDGEIALPLRKAAACIHSWIMPNPRSSARWRKPAAYRRPT